MQNPLRRPRSSAAPPRQAGEPRSERTQRGDPNGDGYLNHDVRAHLVAMSGEFVGTTLFLYFAFAGTQIANTLTPKTAPSLDQLLFISLSFGFSLAVTAWVFFRVSGGLFNPAVTFGMVITGTLPALRGALLFLPQMLGGMVAAALVDCMFPGQLAVQTALQNGTSIAQGLFIEMFLTIELVITVLFMGAEKHKATYMAPVAVGLALFVAELAGVFFTGGSLNPARSFGPAVANRSFQGYHYIYWIGPFLGAGLAGGYYKWAKFNEYEGANPGQDDSHQSEEDDKER